MKRLPGVVASLLLLAAGPSDALQPGKWEHRVVIVDVQMPHPPVGLVESMRGRPTSVVTCLKPEEARLGPRAVLRADLGCTFSRFDADSGKLAMTMVCDRPTGKSTIASEGSFTATGYTLRGRSKMIGQPITIVTQTSGRRIGDC